MKRSRPFIVFTILYFLLQLPTFSQIADKHFIANYNRNTYKASISNFDIIQDQNGFIYAANFSGILIYDGVEWNFVKNEDKSAIYSITKDKKNRIFVGLDKDFGFLRVDKYGRPIFTSLKEEVDTPIEFSSIREIQYFNEKVYFISKEAIFILNKDDKVTILSSPDYSFSYRLFEINNKVYNYTSARKLISIEENPSIIPVPPEIGFITYISPAKERTNLISTFSDGLYYQSDNVINKINSKLSSQLKNWKPFIAEETTFQNETDYLFGSLGYGIIKIDRTLQKYEIVNSSTGLQSDIVKGLTIDNQNNIWTAMQEGISHVELYSPWSFYNMESGIEGTPWDVIRFNNEIYLGTTKGLYVLDKTEFHKIQGIDCKVWTLEILKKPGSHQEILFAGTEKGLFKVSGNLAVEVSKFPEITKLYVSELSPEKLIVGHWTGINSVIFQNNDYISNTISNKKYLNSFSMLSDSSEQLWVSDKFKGIYQIKAINDSVVTASLDQRHGLPDVNKINIIENNKHTLFTTDHGIYKTAITDKGETTFIRDSSLVKEPLNIGVISKAPNGDYYASIINKDLTEHIERFYKVGDEYLRESTPFKRLPEMEIISIYPEENGIVWIAGSEGLFRYDSKVKKDYTLPFNTVISKASVRDSIIFHGFYPIKVEGSEIPGIGIVQPEDMQPTLTYDDNSITFEYSATSYEVPEKNEFSYYLENNDRGWSNWSTETKKEYNNLDPGEYTFFVKSKNIYGTEGRLATYKFRVLAPWYKTAWAYVLWSALTGFVVWFITIAYSVRVRTQRKKLQLIVADRTYEVMTQKKEIEHQNHLLKAKNDEISSQKDDIQKKNIQLRESQEEILSMNQKLTELNMYLEKKVEKRTSKIKATLKQLQQINGELDTFVYRASHDLKGPISRINGITSLAKLESPDDINLKYFDMIEHTAKDMEVLLSKLAQVHEIINSKPRQDEIDIPSLLSEIRDVIKFHDKSLKTKYSFDLSAVNITSDRYLLSIIIKNLIENALIFRKTSSSEPHHIHISTNIKDGIFEIRIKDNGIGIHAPHLNMIFQMFFRGSDKSKGSGLGLYLVKMCVDKLKASIGVESKENEFTEFTVSIPL